MGVSGELMILRSGRVKKDNVVKLTSSALFCHKRHCWSRASSCCVLATTSLLSLLILSSFSRPSSAVRCPSSSASSNCSQSCHPYTHVQFSFFNFFSIFFFFFFWMEWVREVTCGDGEGSRVRTMKITCRCETSKHNPRLVGKTHRLFLKSSPLTPA